MTDTTAPAPGDIYTRLGWSPAGPGCYWKRGAYWVNTYSGPGNDSGYQVWLYRLHLGNFPTFEEASRAADRRQSDRRKAEQ